MLFTYEKMIEYLKILDEESDKIKLLHVGETPMGKPMFITFISAKENINNLDHLKNINKRLALDSDINKEEKEDLVDKGKVFLTVCYNRVR